jgi:Tfp pilus assembly protein PilN
MVQQINLYSPILASPRRYFSAVAMLQALAVFVVVLLALCAWVLASGAALRRELQGAQGSQASERERLTQAIAVQPAASGPALEQELVAARQALATRRALLEELSRGRLPAGRSHAAMLRMVAQTVPTAVWLNELRLNEGRLELSGKTLQPEALRPWLAQLAQHALTADQRLAAIKLERVDSASAAADPVAAAAPAAVPVWSFQLVSKTPTPNLDEAHADARANQGKP